MCNCLSQYSNQSDQNYLSNLSFSYQTLYLIGNIVQIRGRALTQTYVHFMFKFIEKCQSQGRHPDIFAKHTYFLLIMRSKDAFQEIIGSQKYEFMKALVPWCHAVVKTCRKYVSLWINVSFITFFVFGFWSLLATKLRKYKNISKSSFTFCQERWARQKKRERKSSN